MQALFWLGLSLLGAVTSLCKVQCKCNADLVLVGAGCHYLVQSHLSVKSSVSVMQTWLGLAVVAWCSHTSLYIYICL